MAFMRASISKNQETWLITDVGDSEMIQAEIDRRESESDSE